MPVVLLTNGETPVYLKEQMGHSGIDITVNTYGHLIPGCNRQAVNRLDEICSGGDFEENHTKNIF